MSKQPCVHNEVCVWVSESYDCDFEKCSNYLPSLLPVLKRWMKMLDYHSSHSDKRLSLYVDGKAMSVFNVIKHLEKEATEHD
jgi:hypothetical protein